jgi:hypothetical protein
LQNVSLCQRERSSNQDCHDDSAGTNAIQQWNQPFRMAGRPAPEP